jgi:hypothetical protein
LLLWIALYKPYIPSFRSHVWCPLCRSFQKINPWTCITFCNILAFLRQEAVSSLPSPQPFSCPQLFVHYIAGNLSVWRLLLIHTSLSYPGAPNRNKGVHVKERCVDGNCIKLAQAMMWWWPVVLTVLDLHILYYSISWIAEELLPVHERLCTLC